MTFRSGLYFSWFRVRQYVAAHYSIEPQLIPAGGTYFFKVHYEHSSVANRSPIASHPKKKSQREVDTASPPQSHLVYPHQLELEKLSIPAVN